MKGIEADTGKRLTGNRKEYTKYAYSYLGWTRPCTGVYKGNTKLHGN